MKKYEQTTNKHAQLPYRQRVKFLVRSAEIHLAKSAIIRESNHGSDAR